MSTMEFDQSTTGTLLVALFFVIIGGTLMSPMSGMTKAFVSIGIGVFGIAAFYVGIKHGEYRASGR